MQESEIIQGLREGNPAALDPLLELHGDRLLRSAVLLGGDTEEARDLVQETVLQAFRSARRFRGESRLFTWLYGILRNLARGRARRSERLVYTDELPEVPVSGCRAGEGMDRDFDSRAIWRALQRLSDEHREVLVLRYFEELSMEELSACLDVPAGTVKSRLHYALREIRAYLPDAVNLFRSGDTY